MTDLKIGRYMSPLTLSIGVEQSLKTAAAKMTEHKVRHLPVLDGGRLVGVLSERDVHWLASLGTDTSSIAVSEAMSDIPYIVPAETLARTVVQKMHADRLGSALIQEDGRPVGIFTTTDALRLCGDLLS
ncbi:MAG: CBS domain-containing protein [Nannocystaceae bacterium]|nr:CBS domain-containing protein [Nannocystaceae bacterium]